MEITGKRLTPNKKASVMISEGLRVRVEGTLDGREWMPALDDQDGPYVINCGAFGPDRQFAQVRFVIEEIE